MKLLIVSGLSGSGKSTALHALEDFGFYCVDNLPVGLLKDFTNKMKNRSAQHAAVDVAVSIDARNIAEDIQSVDEVLSDIQVMGVKPEVIFIEADENTLLKRFSATRRKHPLTDSERPLTEAISEERKLLKKLSEISNLRIDTSLLNVHQLRVMIRERVAGKEHQSLSIQFVSFGFKHGAPADADFLFDVRCLPNPYWIPELRSLNGQDEEVINYLVGQASVKDMQLDIQTCLAKWVPLFAAENRSYITIAIGCTGGQHRSVCIVDMLAKYFSKLGSNVLTRHRELS